MQELKDELGQAPSFDDGDPAKGRFVRRMFSDIAPRYDLLNHLLSFNLDRRWRAAAVDELGWERCPEGRYLDLCAGTLDLSIRLATRPSFQGNVVAADFAVPMLVVGAAKTAGRAVFPLASDALQLPVGDATFDGAICGFGVRNLAGLDAGLAEVCRVLKRGARFVILEFSTPRSPFFRALYHAFFHRVLPRVGRRLSGHPSAYSYLPASVSSFPAEGELADRMNRCGFHDVKWRSLLGGVAAIHVGEKA